MSYFIGTRRHAAPHGRTLVASIGTVLIALAAFASAGSPAWELRVCADPNSLPYSHRNGEGFENRLAELLADELGAELSYDWSAYSPDMIDLRLRAGECDAIIGVPDGEQGLLTTVAYYRGPYAFVTLADTGPTIESLDDPALHTLRIGVQNVGIPPQEALLNRGITDVQGPDGREPNTPDRVIGELVNDEIDVGIMWGPNAAYFARVVDAEVLVTPVTPEFEPPFLFMSVPMTIGVRPGDHALRDRLDLAIAARWGEIQALLSEVGVPLAPMPAPVASLAAGAIDASIHVGVLLPRVTGSRTNATSLYDLVGDAAFHGVELATTDANAAAGADRFRLLTSSTPSVASARRAAERMLALGDVDVLIGGMGEGQAEVLAELATDHDMLFLDVGSTSLVLRERCYPTTLHVEAHEGMYLDAFVGILAERGARSWFIVHERGEAGERTAQAARAAVAVSGGSVAGAAAVAPGLPVYSREAAAIREARPDGVLVLLGARDQIAFLGQARDMGVEAILAPLPLPVTQTRDFLGATLDRVALEGPQLRVVAFEPTRAAGPEGTSTGEAAGSGEGSAAAGSDVAERFAARYGEPMEASAFAGYQAMRILDRAVVATGRSDAETVVSHLTDPGTILQGPKGEVQVRSSDRQLLQSLDVIEADPAAGWRNTLAGKVGIASFVEARLQASPDAAEAETTCTTP